ncbi:MAG TPA: NAD(P)H-hydrate dehydratase [Gemmataceae bacterium]|nr:NAD(P)H-hydrate dehydratase [Gemmataceae bacterium]
MPTASPIMVSAVPSLPPRAPDSHKGDFGRVLVVAGSRGMSGAAILCATAALRGGAGLVRVAVPADVLPVVAGGNPCYMTAPLPHDEQGRLAAQAEAEVLRLAAASDVIAAGPGLGPTPAVAAVVRALLARTQGPLVLDADALNVLAGQTEALRGRTVPPILTPHPGEFARLIGRKVSGEPAERLESAVRFAADHGVVLVLKGLGTVVTDGRRAYVNTTGNPGMATGGSGDVLTGLIAALLGQRLEPFAAAQLGAHIHGLAGDLARIDNGEVSLIATDLIAYLPRTFRRFGGGL